MPVYAIYLWSVRPYNLALLGGFELATTLATLCALGLSMAVMDGRGASDVMRCAVVGDRGAAGATHRC